MHPQRAHFFSAASAPTPLRLDGVSFRYDSRPEQPVLTDVSLTVPPGRTVGLIGENGSGKSTALRLLSGAALPDHGIVEAPESLGVLQQMPAAAGRAGTVADLLRQAAAPLRALEHRIEALAAQMAEEPLPDAPSSLAQQWDDALAEAQHRSLWSLEARVETVLDGLGLGALPRSRPLQELSGGQRRRLDLAAALLHTPHALLLDEPTNHLDDEAADFLVAELRSWRGPVLMASHDRWLLDAAADAVVDLDPGLDPEGRGGGHMGTLFSGGFSSYLEQREQLRSVWAARWREQEQQRQRWEAEARLEHADVFHRSTGRSEARIAQKFYADRAATTLNRRTRAAHRHLEELQRQAVPPPPVPVRLGEVPTPAPGAPSEAVLVLDGAGVSGRLSAQDLVVRRGEHVLLTGPNGAGKSTLIGILDGSVAPDTGQVLRRDGLRMAVLAQAAGDRPTAQPSTAGPGEPPTPAGILAVTELSAEAAREPHGERTQPPGPVELGLLRPEDLQRPLHELSPGQRQRFELARVLAASADVLLLDEPTNHLSLGLAEDLERALADWPGTVVLCTHDRWIRDRWRGRHLELGI